VTDVPQIGAWTFGGSFVDFFSGTLDEVRIYDRALSQAEVQADMNTPLGGSSPPGDTTPPTVSMSAPAAGAVVSGTNQTISASASDTVGVVGVQFLLDGATFGVEDTTAPYSVAWNTTMVANGPYTLSARARDAAGNIGTATAITVTVSNATADTTPPTASVTAPAEGATVSGSPTVSATAGDNVGVVGVQFLLDGTPLGSEDLTAPYSVTWNTLAAANGPHTLSARARDAAGNSATSSAVTVTVSNAAGSQPAVAYGFNEGVGATVADASGNNRTGSAVGTTWSSGQYGGGLVFNGTSARVAVPSLTLPSTFTLMVWMRNPSRQAYETIVSVGPDRNLFLRNGVLTFEAPNGTRTFGSAISTNVWHHVALTSDGTTLRAYLDGVPLGTSQSLGVGAVTDAPQIGAWIYGGSFVDFFSGTLDEVRIYNRVLSEAEVQADMNTPLP
jgi:hypothetical protein